MNAQEIFDKVVAHLRQQNTVCRAPDGMCLYRNDQGLSCAVGCLISDEEYSLSMEENTVVQMLHSEHCPISLRDRLASYIPLLTQLQKIHDNDLPSKWEESFQYLASRYNLQYSPKSG